MQKNGEISSTTSKTDVINAFIQNGYALVRCAGKKPCDDKGNLLKEWTRLKPDPTDLPEDYPENYGVVFQPGQMVIDIDPRNFKKDETPFKELCELLGTKFENTFVVKSGGGGYHIYLKVPADRPTALRHKDFKGIEFLREGHHVLGPGSKHPKTGKLYTVYRGSLGDIQEAPEQLIELLETGVMRTDGLDEDKDDLQTQERFIEYCETTDPAIENNGGDDLTYRVACKGRDFGLSKHLCYSILLEYFNPRCSPLWSTAELQTKVNNAYAYAKGGQGSAHPEADFEKLPDMEKSESTTDILWNWDMRKSADTQGKYPLKTNDTDNTVNYFRLPEFGTFKNPLYKLIGYNIMTQRFEFRHKAPWHENGISPKTWTDIDTNQLRYYLSNEKHYMSNKECCADAMEIYAAKFNSFHPIRDYLKSLEWDGVPRISSLFVKYAGADNTLYHREIARCWMIAGVARAMDPGCKFDHLPILEGNQGIGKSTFCEIIAGKDFYADIPLETHNRDFVDTARGFWVIELSEMECTKRADVAALKSFITRTSDNVRRAYARYSEEIKRPYILIGTINPEADRGYLRDTTGNRRFWPCAVTKIDFEGLKADRDQLWAEAYHRYKEGESFHLTNKQAIDEAKNAQDEREVLDAYAELIDDYFHKRNKEYVYTGTDIAVEVLEIPKKSISHQDLSRIANVMQKILKWEKGKFYCRVKEKTVNGYRHPHFNPAFFDDL